MKICVVGTGYVGLSLCALLSQKYQVIALDISQEKVDLINQGISPINDQELTSYLNDKPLDLKATVNKQEAYENADYIIVATPTNYDTEIGSFDTSNVEIVISDCIKLNPNSTIIIKSTVPLGFTDKMRIKYKKKEIIFSPEFLRESKALYDNLYPSRIVVGDNTTKAKKFGEMLMACSHRNKSEILLLNMSSKEAEAVKLFSNSFLAMRVAFFNELDSFSEINNISTEKIIGGVSSDPRIGNYYNNPSFGYGGYCLPKDTKQLLANFGKIPNNIIKAVVESNGTRKDFIVESIIKKKPKTVGIYRLIMKEGSDNYRESAILDIVEKLSREKVEIIIYEPFIDETKFKQIEIISNLSDFISRSDLIVANRTSSELKHVSNKVYSRDLFSEN